MHVSEFLVWNAKLNSDGKRMVKDELYKELFNIKRIYAIFFLSIYIFQAYKNNPFSIHLALNLMCSPLAFWMLVFFPSHHPFHFYNMNDLILLLITLFPDT